MRSLFILVTLFTGSSHAQNIAADNEGNLVASVDDGKQLIIKQGGVPVAIVDEIKQVRREAVDNAAAIENNARTSREEAQCSDSVADVVGKVATLIDTVKPANTSSSDAALADISANVAAAVEQLTKVASIMTTSASNSAGAPPPITYSSVIYSGECGKTTETACEAIYHANDPGANDNVFSLLVRTNGGGYYNSDGIYECTYTLETTGAVVTTPAVLEPEKGSATAGRVACLPPVQDPTKTKKAAWGAQVGLLEGGFAVPRVNAAGEAVDSAAKLFFSSGGPAISGIPDTVSTTAADLTESVATLSFSVEDRDSVEANIVVTAKAKNEKFVTALKVAVADGIYTLSITVDKDYDGDKITEITVSAVDEHDQKKDFTFTFVVAGYVGFWARMSADKRYANSEGSKDIPIGDTTKGYPAWRIMADDDDADDNTFQVGSAFDVKTGKFTAPVDGYYMVACQIRVDEAMTEYNQIKVYIDGTKRSMVSIKGNKQAASYDTHRISGTLKLKAGQTLSLAFLFQSQRDNYITIQKESGFGVVKVPDKTDGLVGTQQGCHWHPKVAKTGIRSNYGYFNNDVCSDSGCGSDQVGGFELNGIGLAHSIGKYYVQEDGIYKIDITSRFDGLSGGGDVRLLLQVDETNDGVDYGMHVFDTEQSTNYHSMNVGSHMYLRKGSRIGLAYERGGSNDAWQIHYDTSFSAIRLGPKDMVGFMTEQSANHNYGAGYSEMRNLVQPDNYLAWGNSLSSNQYHQYYEAPKNGIYSVSAAQLFDEASGDYWRLMITKNSGKSVNLSPHRTIVRQAEIGLNSGIHAIRGQGSRSPYSLSVNGFMRLKKGDTLHVYTYGPKSWTAFHQSGFSVAMIHELK